MTDRPLVELKAAPYLTERARATFELVAGFVRHSANDATQLLASQDMLDLLVEWEMPAAVLNAGVLLPLMQSGGVRPAEVREIISQRVGDLLATVVPLVAMKDTAVIRNTESPIRLRRDLYLLAYQDSEAALLIIALRLISLGAIDEMSDSIRAAWCTTNKQVYIPLMQLLGLMTYANALHEIGLRLTDRTAHMAFEARIRRHYSRYESLLQMMRLQMQSRLDREDGATAAPILRAAEVLPHHLHVGAAQGMRDVLSRFEVDVIVPTPAACYSVLGHLHALWPPIESRGKDQAPAFQDWIAVPRRNGYRALITTLNIADDEGRTHQVVCRIQTPAFIRVNNHGIIAARLTNQRIKGVWWQDDELAQVVSVDHKNSIMLLTPDGDILTGFTADSTMVDAAFRIHSSLGPYAAEFYANGRQVNFRYTLRPFDLIDIRFDRSHPSATDDWLTAAGRPRTRRLIRRHLRQQRNLATHVGERGLHNVLERESRILEVRLDETRLADSLQRIMQRLGYADLTGLYEAIARGRVSPDAVVVDLLEAEFLPHIALADRRSRSPGRMRLSRAWMQLKGEAKWDRDQRVVPGEAIVGEIKDDILIVHSEKARDCPTGEARVDLVWRALGSNEQWVDVQMAAAVQPGTVPAILARLDALRIAHATGLVLGDLRVKAEAQQQQIDIMVNTARCKGGLAGLEGALQGLRQEERIFDYHIWQILPGRKRQYAGLRDRRQHNPYTLRQVRDRTMFFGRDGEIQRIVDHLREDDSFVVLYGQKRIGKTSLLHHLAEYVLPQHTRLIPVMFDLHSITPFDAPTLLNELAVSAHRALLKWHKGRDESPAFIVRKNPPPMVDWRSFSSWVKQVEAELHGYRLLFLVDEFTRAEEEYRRGTIDGSFFDGLQWLVGNQFIGFLLCVHDHIYRDGTRSWAVLQRGHPVHLGYLDLRAAQQLIRRPLSGVYHLDEMTVNHIVSLTYCHPYLVQAVCLELTATMAQSTETEVHSGHVDAAVSTVLRTGDHYFSHFTGRTDAFALNILKVMASLSEENDDWLSRDMIRDAMADLWDTESHLQFSHAIGHLYQDGLIEVKNFQGAVKYRIPIPLFQYWLRQRTHPLVRRDMQRVD